LRQWFGNRDGSIRNYSPFSTVGFGSNRGKKTQWKREGEKEEKKGKGGDCSFPQEKRRRGKERGGGKKKGEKAYPRDPSLNTLLSILCSMGNEGEGAEKGGGKVEKKGEGGKEKKVGGRLGLFNIALI